MKIRYALIVLITLIFTVFAIYNSAASFRMAQQSSESQLRSTAYFIGITLDQALNRIGIDSELFLDVIKSQPWEGIAFIALYDINGKVLLHSSKRLIGSSTNDTEIRKSIENPKSHSSYLKLLTGETVYVMDLPIHIHALVPSLQLLRIALHPYPSRKAIQHAKIHGITASVFVCFLWVLALAYLRYSWKIDELQRREFERSRFVMLGEMSAVLAHEIRSPLSAIKGFAQYISEKAGKDSSMDEGLGVIVSESQRLERLTEDLLIYSRPGEIRPESFSLLELIEEVKGLFISEDKTITIKKDMARTNDVLFTDREKLRQVLINIIQNSMDSIKDEGTIEIQASVENKTVHISIRDSGEGMGEETRKKARQPFFTTRTKGTGLGLGIVENLLKALHGTFSIKSALNQGTTVSISLQRTLR